MLGSEYPIMRFVKTHIKLSGPGVITGVHVSCQLRFRVVAAQPKKKAREFNPRAFREATIGSADW
jgi:hypothetical protein